MTEIRWEDPSPPKTRHGKWRTMLLPLMDQPKRWAIMVCKDTKSRADSTASNLRFGMMKLPPGRWEFASRTVDGEHRVYARYLGPDEDSAS